MCNRCMDPSRKSSPKLVAAGTPELEHKREPVRKREHTQARILARKDPWHKVDLASHGLRPPIVALPTQ